METIEMVTEQRKMRIVRPAAGGQITIPDDFRRELGIDEDSVLQMTLDGDELRVRRLATTEQADNNDWFGALYDLFAPARQEAIEKGYTEQEINDAIDEAAAAVRRERRGHG